MLSLALLLVLSFPWLVIIFNSFWWVDFLLYSNLLFYLSFDWYWFAVNYPIKFLVGLGIPAGTKQCDSLGGVFCLFTPNLLGWTILILFFGTIYYFIIKKLSLLIIKVIKNDKIINRASILIIFLTLGGLFLIIALGTTKFLKEAPFEQCVSEANQKAGFCGVNCTESIDPLLKSVKFNFKLLPKEILENYKLCNERCETIRREDIYNCNYDKSESVAQQPTPATSNVPTSSLFDGIKKIFLPD